MVRQKMSGIKCPATNSMFLSIRADSNTLIDEQADGLLTGEFLVYVIEIVSLVYDTVCQRQPEYNE